MNEYRFADIRPGLAHSFRVTVTEVMMDRFRDITGDENPLHTQRDFAAAYGYRDRIVNGLLTASFYSTLVGVYLPGRFAFLQSADVAFTAVVFPGDRLTVSGEVASVHDAFRRIELKAQIVNQHGHRVSRARIHAGLHE